LLRRARSISELGRFQTKPKISNIQNIMSQNEQILDQVNSKILALEAAFAEHDAQSDRKTGIAIKLAQANSDEQDALNVSDDEKAVKQLLTAQAMKAVHTARIGHVAVQIATQQAAVISAGHEARTFAVEAAQQWINHRLAVSLAVVEATYLNQPLGNPAHLARHAKSVIDAEKLTAGVSIFANDATELDKLRGFRAAFAPIAEACKIESGLELSFPKSWIV
jgi:hypothetical protein